jgi:phosphoribosylaminoimidazole-succinocarboxamide synthase
MTETVFQSKLSALDLVYRGKVRDVYAVDDNHLLILVSDRLSAFDVVMPDPIPGKGQVLTAISNFWFGRTRHIVPNHLTDTPLESVLTSADDRAQAAERSVIVRRLAPLPIEAVVRGYLIGSGWKDYQRTGAVCGIALPRGLRLADRLPEPIFTPATKAAAGQHDDNISLDDVAKLIGHDVAERVRDCALAIYRHASDYASERGIIIADTKFEFALDGDDLVLVDEALTPDSSRFWPASEYEPGASPPSFDKQYVRDYLETLDWNKTAPGPRLPANVIAQTSAKYREALRRLTE